MQKSTRRPSFNFEAPSRDDVSSLERAVASLPGLGREFEALMSARSSDVSDTAIEIELAALGIDVGDGL